MTDAEFRAAVMRVVGGALMSTNTVDANREARQGAQLERLIAEAIRNAPVKGTCDCKCHASKLEVHGPAKYSGVTMCTCCVVVLR